jgi:GntR family transcriptional regulator, negative regulator for fad regulon and positive regulator of fabA
MNFEFPNKPAEMAETQLITAILNNTFPINSNLPPERDLAVQLGITRPTLREALQRLARDGWIEIRHGKSTRVRDYWREGSLSILGAIARQQKDFPGNFIDHLLQIRSLLAPTYFKLALENKPTQVLNIIKKLQTIPDEAITFTNRDWDLHSEMTFLSGNPVFGLILNGFKDLYHLIGPVYFTSAHSRQRSHNFYAELLLLAEKQDADGFESATRKVMEDSIALWLSLKSQKS